LNKRKRALLALAAAMALLLIIGGSLLLLPKPQTLNPKPDLTPHNPLNVVLIILDALRADRVFASRNGIPLMPNLAEFSKRCVQFTHANTPCTWTRPAMASILTSLYVDTHQVYYGPDPQRPNDNTSDALPKSFENMATYLKRAGYATAVVQTNGNLVRDLGFGEGFDEYEYLPDETADKVTPCALRHLEGLRDPFFLYLHYMDPHLPYTPPERFRKLFGWPPPIDDSELAIVNDFMGYVFDHDEYKVGNKPSPSYKPLSPAAEEAVRTLYDAEARSLDEELGKFLDALLQRKPNTLIVITADHGEHLWDHDYLGHGLTMYEAELRVPFFIYLPDGKPQTIDTDVNTVNILPTISECLGLPANPAWQGRSLFSTEAAGKAQPIFSHTLGPWRSYNIEYEAVKVGRFKLIVNRKKEHNELYDMVDDSEETNDLSAQRSDAVRAMLALLVEHRNQNARARGNVQKESVKLSPELMKQLQDLGYGRSASGMPTSRPVAPTP